MVSHPCADTHRTQKETLRDMQTMVWAMGQLSTSMTQCLGSCSHTEL